MGFHEDESSYLLWLQSGEDPQGFIDEVFKVLDSMGVSSQEKVELTAYQLKDVAQVWYEQWKDEGPIREGPVS